VALVNELRHQRLEVTVIRARVEFDFHAGEEDIERVHASRRRINESELSPCGYLCRAPRRPPKEIDIGNPSDGTMICRRGERCPGCPIAVAVDAFHMVKRAVEIELLRESMSLSVWSDSHLPGDLEVLHNDLAQWEKAEVDRYREYWLEEFRSGRRLINPWSSMN